MVSRFFTACLLLCSVLFTACCCTPDPLEPQPTTDLDQMIERTVHQWIDVRVSDQADVDRLRVPGAVWRSATTIPAFVQSPELLDLGNAQAIFDQITGSALYGRAPPSDSDLLNRVKVAVDSYTFEE